MKDRPRILVLTYTPLAREPRALKQVRYLRDAYDIATAGFGATPFLDVPHIEIPNVGPQRWGILGRLLSLVFLVLHWYRPLTWINALDRHTARLLRGGEWDIVIAHDLKTLDAAFKLAPQYGVVLDLHEYAPRQEEQSFLWRMLIAPYFRWMCRTKVPQAAAVITVGHGIAAEYRREFGFDASVVINATPYQDLTGGTVGTPIRLVHSGAVSVQRRLDIVIEGVRDSVADVTLDLYLVGNDSSLLSRLHSLAANDPRIRFRDAVPYSELIKTLNGYDVGIHLLPPVNFNHLWALPNKFFDYVQARLGVVIGPSAEMQRIVRDHGIGVITDDFTSEALTQVLDQLSPGQVVQWKEASQRAALTLSGESQLAALEGVIAGVMESSPRKES